MPTVVRFPRDLCLVKIEDSMRYIFGLRDDFPLIFDFKEVILPPKENSLTMKAFHLYVS